MSIPPKYEDLVLKVAEMERREAALLEEASCLKAVLNGMEFKQVDDMVSDGVDACLFLGQESARIIKGIQAERAELREELESIKASIDGYDSPEHAAQVADEMGHQCDALQQRLTVAEQLLRRVIACGELTRIDHAELEADVCKWLEPVTPAEPVTFGHEYNNLSVAERSAMQVTARIQEVAALKPAEECPHNYSNPTGCPVCQGIQP